MTKKIAAADVLKRMRTLLRRGWTQGCGARSGRGREVAFYSPKAVAWCIYGANNKACFDLNADHNLSIRVSRVLLQCLPKGEHLLAHWNDQQGRVKKDVITLVDCAIKKA